MKSKDFIGQIVQAVGREGPDFRVVPEETTGVPLRRSMQAMILSAAIGGVVVLIVGLLATSVFFQWPLNFTTRMPFEAAELPISVEYGGRALQGIEDDTKPPSDQPNRWTKWILEGLGRRASKDERVIVIKQRRPFESNFQSFDVELNFNADMHFSDCIGFLVSSDAKQSVFRAIEPRTVYETRVDSSGRIRYVSKQLPIIRIPEPNKGDVVQIYLTVGANGSAQLPDNLSDYRFRLNVMR